MTHTANTPAIYFATRRSTRHPKPPPFFSVIDLRYLDTPPNVATEDHAQTTHSPTIWASKPPCLVVTASVTPAPYTRTLTLAIKTDDPGVLPDELTIIALAENPAEITAAMEIDVARFVKEAEERGLTGRESWSNRRGGFYCHEKCHAEVAVLYSRETTSWDFWMQPVTPELAERATRDRARVPTEWEERAKMILGERMLDTTEGGGRYQFAKLSWADMGLRRGKEG